MSRLIFPQITEARACAHTGCTRGRQLVPHAMPVVVEQEKSEPYGNAFAGRAAIFPTFRLTGRVCIHWRRFKARGILSMSALRHCLRNLFQRKSLGGYGHIQDFQGVPFYEARQPWWAKFTWGIIAADLFVT